MLTLDAIQLKQLMHHCLTIDAPLMVWGPTGCGKTQITRQACSETGYVCLDYLLLLRDQVDLRGAPVPDMEAGETRWLRPDDLPFKGSRRFDPSKRYVIHFDEINTAPPSLQAVAFQLVLERRAGPHELQDGTRIIACGNRQSDRGAAQKMPVPLENRFRHALLMPDVVAFARHCNAIGSNPILPAFIRFRPELLHALSPTDPTHCSPRIWLDQVAKDLDLPPPFRQQAFSSAVGEGPAAELEGFIGLFTRLPPIREIIANPTTAVTPDNVSRDTKERLGLRFAVAVALGRAATRQNFAACLTYGARLPREMSIVMVVDAVKRDPELMNTSAFVGWAKVNQDVTL
jgi:hypothetical protein